MLKTDLNHLSIWQCAFDIEIHFHSMIIENERWIFFLKETQWIIFRRFQWIQMKSHRVDKKCKREKTSSMTKVSFVSILIWLFLWVHQIKWITCSALFFVDICSQSLLKIHRSDNDRKILRNSSILLLSKLILQINMTKNKAWTHRNMRNMRNMKKSFHLFR